MVNHTVRQLLRERRPNGLPAATAVPSPTAPQNLGELHERMNDALLFALSRNRELPSYTIPNVSNSANAQNKMDFGQAELLGVPGTITVSGGRAVEPVVHLRFLTGGGTDASCFYKAGNGASANTYRFNYCTTLAYEAVCSATGIEPLCKSLLSLGIKEGDTVVAKAVQVPLSSCGRNCTGTMQLAVTLPNVNPACEGLALSNVHFLQHVQCDAPNHVGLQVFGAGNTVDGHSYSLRSPGSEIGLFISGDDTAVRNLDVSNVGGGYGMMAYDTNSLLLFNNRFRANLVGALVYTDSVNTTGLQIQSNDMSGNAFSALILTGDGKRTDNPSIFGNSFANTGGYAVSMDADHVSISGSQNNNYNGSRGALYLMNGNFTVSNLDLSRSGATGPQIFAESAASITVSNTNLTYNTPAQSSQERTALHLYRVGSLTASKLTVAGSDVAVKVTTEQGTATKISITNSKLTNAVVAAVMLQSWDDTRFGLTTITGNVLTGAPQGYSIWQVGGVGLGSGSVISGNTQ